MGLKNLILKENPTPGGGTKYVPRGIVLLIVIGAAIGFAIYKGTHSASESVKQTIDKMEKVEASKKAGIKKLGGQPRVASASGAGATDISDIWATAPDVSEVFK